MPEDANHGQSNGQVADVSKRNIILVGFMGTGKTTVGKRLARKLGMEFLDMDCVIEERQGKKISAIFAEEGEPFFRSLERSLVQELAARQGMVIAAGGGIVLNADNITDYSRTGLVVCLTATPEVILERVSRSNHRPLLEGDEKLKRIREILEKRQALYDAIPHQIDTTSLPLEAVADRILEMLSAPQ